MNTNQTTRPRLLILGATGGTGTALVRHAINRGYDTRVCVRDEGAARRLFQGLVPVPHIVKGDAIDGEQIDQALSHSVDAVVSAMGIFQAREGSDDLTRATKNILTAMQKNSVRRFICVSSLGVGDSRNQGNFLARLVQKTVLKHTLADKEMQEAAVRACDIDWTLIRPSQLTNGNGSGHFHTWMGPQPKVRLRWAISRDDVARFALDCLEDDATIRCAINITGCKAG